MYFCCCGCCGPPNHSWGSCVFLLLWPCKLYWGFLCISLCRGPSNHSVGFSYISIAVANYWAHAMYLKWVLSSFPIWDAYSFQFACGTFWRGPTLFATKVTTTLCGMWNLGRSSFYYTDIVPVRKYDCDITIATSNSPFLFVAVQCALSHLLSINSPEKGEKTHKRTNLEEC